MPKALLNRSELCSEIAVRRLTIEPFDPVRLRPASYVLSLGRRFRRWRSSATPINIWSPDAAEQHLLEPEEAEELTIGSGGFLLACTREKIGISDSNFAVISPLSHVARFGLGIHCGADYVNPGFGQLNPTSLTLELFNHNPSPITLTAGMPIAHLRVGCIEHSHVRTASFYEGRDPLIAPRFYEEMAAMFYLESPNNDE